VLRVRQACHDVAVVFFGPGIACGGGQAAVVQRLDQVGQFLDAGGEGSFNFVAEQVLIDVGFAPARLLGIQIAF